MLKIFILIFQNDVELFINLKDRVRRVCKEYNVELLELYGVVFFIIKNIKWKINIQII